MHRRCRTSDYQKTGISRGVVMEEGVDREGARSFTNQNTAEQQSTHGLPKGSVGAELQRKAGGGRMIIVLRLRIAKTKCLIPTWHGEDALQFMAEPMVDGTP